jgi:hypothetical protein
MWEYTQLPKHHQILSEQAAHLASLLRSNGFDILGVLRDSRWIHKNMFLRLAPKGMKYLAGGYRGDPKGALKNCTATIPSNPLVGSPPAKVATDMAVFAADATAAVLRLDGLHGDTTCPDDDRLIATVEVACRLIAEFLLIHPYANGNGHVARFMLLGILARYGYQMKNFDLHPAPFTPSYSDSIAAYQKSIKAQAGGDKDRLHKYVLSCLK